MKASAACHHLWSSRAPLLFAIAVFFRLSVARADTGVELLPASSEIPAYSVEGKSLDGRWVVVCDHHGKSELIPVDLTFSKPACEKGRLLCDDGEKTVLVSLPAMNGCTFMVRGVTLDSRKEIPSANLRDGCSLRQVGSRCPIDADQNALVTKGDANTSSEATPKSFFIELDRAGQTQTLWDVRQEQVWDDPNFEVHWAGDLDGDGKTDFLVTLSGKYTTLASVLFLSSQAASGQLVGKAAVYSVSD